MCEDFLLCDHNGDVKLLLNTNYKNEITNLEEDLDSAL